MYYKLDLANRKITTLAAAALAEHTMQLNKKHYRPVSISIIKSFLNNEAKLPGNSFLIVLGEPYSQVLKKAVTVLAAQHISIFIFLPILISADSIKYQHKMVQQLNDFMFSDEFKNIFCYTQPNNLLFATIK